MGSKGLSEDGGINFSRKRNFDEKEEDKKSDEIYKRKKREEIEQLNRQERLSRKLQTAKTINYSGFALNGGSILFLAYGINNIAYNGNTIDMVNLITKTFNIDFDYLNFLDILETWKAQLMASAGSLQIMFVGFQQFRQRMKDADREDTFSFLNEELGRVI